MAKCIFFLCMTFLVVCAGAVALQPCLFEDTVDLTYATRLANNTYYHEGVHIPAELVAMYDYVEESGKQVLVAAHPRGCICKLKPCVNICCPQSFILDAKTGQCVSVNSKTAGDWSEAQAGSLRIYGNFFLKTFKPCAHMLLLQPEIYASNQWQLLANGSLLRSGELQNLLATNEFCLTINAANQVQAAECSMGNTKKALESYSLTVDEHTSDGIHVPCSFFDTVNITEGQRFNNGSYLHEGIIIPSYLIGVYDYVYVDLTARVSVEPHLRGCVCKLRPCISFCCPWGTKYNTNTSICEYTDEVQWPEAELNITMADDTVQPIQIFKFFAIQTFRPCEIMYPLQPALEPEDEYKLYENGSMLRVQDNEYMTKNEYCLVPTLNNESDLVFTINPANCAKATEYTVLKRITAMGKFFHRKTTINSFNIYVKSTIKLLQ